MADNRQPVPTIVYVLGLALFVRCSMVLAWFVLSGDLGALHTPDTATYLAPAHSLLERGAFEADSAPEIVRGPGYPLLLTLGLAAGHVEAVTLVVQVLLSVATTYLVYRCALAIDSGQRVALLAAALYALEPISVIYCCFLLTETLYTFLLVSCLLLLLRYLHDYSARCLGAAAALLVASAFVRPVSYYLPIVVAGVLVCAGCARTRLRPQIALAGAFLLLCAVPLGLWQWRNWQQTGYPGFAAIVESDLYFFQMASIDALLEHRPLIEKQTELGLYDQRLLAAAHPEWQGLSKGQLHVQLGRLAKRDIAGHPWIYARLHLRNILTLLVTPGSGDVMRLTGDLGQPAAATSGGEGVASGLARVVNGGRARIVTALALVAISLAYLALAVAGCFQTMPSRFRWTLIVIAGYFWFVSCLPQPPARLRHPLMPIVCLLAAYALSAMFARRSGGAPMPACFGWLGKRRFAAQPHLETQAS